MMADAIATTGKVLDIGELGKMIRAKRKSKKLKQAECANLCGVGTRFLSELENGKSTIEIGKAMEVLHGLGLDITITERSWS
tara:strand:- start:2377 stop:2622 length:246 start_codon:yes stop_codon:yes gene_type:complete